MYKGRGHVDSSSPWQECLDHKTKLKTRESSNSQKDWKKKTCQYYEKDKHVEKNCSKKRTDLEENGKKIDDDVTVV